MILPLLATLAFWCAVAVGVRHVLDKGSEVKQAVNGDRLNNANQDGR